MHGTLSSSHSFGPNGVDDGLSYESEGSDSDSTSVNYKPGKGRGSIMYQGLDRDMSDLGGGSSSEREELDSTSLSEHHAESTDNQAYHLGQPEDGREVDNGSRLGGTNTPVTNWVRNLSTQTYSSASSDFRQSLYHHDGLD